MIDEYLENVAVVGASGKMGRGIALLLLQEMTIIAEKYQKNFTLHCIDVVEESFYSLKEYLREQLIKFSEKNILLLRTLYEENQTLVSNEEMISHFVTRALDMTNFQISLSSAKNANLVFEAVLENYTAKCSLYKELNAICKDSAFFFTNTSSIPIGAINHDADLHNRIIGFHFYNPPAVQQLIEIIHSEMIDPTLEALADELAKRLNKVVVYAKDIAGFIGNGHFIPEGIFACHQVDKLRKSFTLKEAIYLVNKVTQDYLIRPMGIFQLIDYVGIDVFYNIAHSMQNFSSDDTLNHSLISEMVERGVVGGQNSDGSQKEGFFKYSGTKVEAIFDLDQGKYQSLESAKWLKRCEDYLGPLPESHRNWKKMQKCSEKDKKLESYFRLLFQGQTEGEKLASSYLHHSYEIANSLVEKEVAASSKDVSTVLQKGFYHLYGPDAPWLQSIEKVGGAK